MLLNNHFEWKILSKNYVKRLNSIRKFRASLSILNHRRFSSTFTHSFLSESHSMSPFLHLYPKISKNVESDFSTIYSFCRQWKESLGTNSPFVHSASAALSNLIEVRIFMDYLEVIRGFGYSQSSLPHWSKAYICSISFIRRILPYST